MKQLSHGTKYISLNTIFIFILQGPAVFFFLLLHLSIGWLNTISYGYQYPSSYIYEDIIYI